MTFWHHDKLLITSGIMNLPRTLTPLLLACSLLGGCSLVGGADDYVIQVDSVAVAPPTTPAGVVRITYSGFIGANGCAELRRVERRALPGDTLQLRFIGRQEGGDCLQMPVALRYVDSLPNLPARTVHLQVLQRSGSPLRSDIVLPLTSAP